MKKIMIMILLIVALAFCQAAELDARFELAKFTFLEQGNVIYNHIADSVENYLGDLNGSPLVIETESSMPWKAAEIKARIKTAETINFVDYDVDDSITNYFDLMKKPNEVNEDSNLVYIHFMLTDKDPGTDEGAGLTNIIELDFAEYGKELYIIVRFKQKE